MYDGFDPTGIAAVFGATAAAARVMGLDGATTLHALALAFNRCGGSFQSNIDGSLAVRLQQGLVAETGVECAQFAAAGITGPVNFLEGRYGFTHLYARGLAAPGDFVAALGTRWLMNDFMYKRYPSCGVTQGVTRQALDVTDELDLQPDDVARVVVRMPPYSHRLVGNPFTPGANPRVERAVQRAVLRRQRHHPPFGDARPLPARDGAGARAGSADGPHRRAGRSRRWTLVVTARSISSW